MAAAALEAPLWGEARKHLEAAGGEVIYLPNARPRVRTRSEGQGAA